MMIDFLFFFVYGIDFVFISVCVCVQKPLMNIGVFL